METLLVAPLRTGVKPENIKTEVSHNDLVYENRNSFDEGLLRQQTLWALEGNVTFELDHLLSSATAELSGVESPANGYVVVVKAELTQVAGQYILWALAQVDEAPVNDLPIDEIENILNGVVREFLTKHAAQIKKALKRGGGEVSPIWVNRTLLVQRGEQLREDWLMPGHDPIDIPLPDEGALLAEASAGINSSDMRADVELMEADSFRSKFRVGWGNNVIENADCLRSGEVGELDAFIQGMLDAQAVWLILDKLNFSTKNQLIDFSTIDTADKKPKTEYLKLARNSYITLAALRVFYSEIKTSLKGLRKEVAGAILAAWGYDDQFQLLEQRVTDIENVASANSQLKARKFQKGTAIATGLLSGLVILQTAIDLISLAFSGRSGYRGVEVTPISLLSLVERTGADIVIAISLGLTFMASTIMIKNAER